MATVMKDRPILFSGEMVRAILDGKKTQTRRIVKNPESFTNIRECGFCCPFGVPSSRLWVRETFRHYGNTSTRNDEWRACVQYKADDARLEIGCWPSADEAPSQKWWNTGKQPWTPPIHMPRWASRLTLEVTDVRVERLQEIGEADAQYEGVERPVLSAEFIDGIRVHPMTGHYRDGFRELWDKLNGPRGFAWASNPWVYVVSFKRIEA